MRLFWRLKSRDDAENRRAGRTIIPAIVSSISVRGIGAGLALSLNIFLARLLGVVQYGRYMTMLSMALVVGGLAIRGVDQVLTRELAGRVGRTSDGRRILALWSTRRVGIGVVLGIAVFIVWALFLFERKHGVIDTREIYGVFVAGGLLVISIAFRGALSGALNGYSASVRSQAIGQIVQNGSVLLLLVLSSIFWGPRLSVEGALWLQLTGYLLALTIGMYWLWQLTKQRAEERPTMPLAGTFFTSPSKHWSKASRYFLLTSIAGLLISRLDVVLMSSVVDSRAVGIYVAGARLGQVGMLAALAVSIVLGPRIANAHQSGNYSDIKKLLVYGWRVSIPVALLEVIAGWFLGPYLVRLFGPAYSASTQTFAWVITGYALWTAASPAYARLSMTGREHWVAGISWVVLVANIILLFVLAPIYKATGAAVAMAVGYGAGTMIVLALLWMGSTRAPPSMNRVSQGSPNGFGKR